MLSFWASLGKQIIFLFFSKCFASETLLVLSEMGKLLNMQVSISACWLPTRVTMVYFCFNHIGAIVTLHSSFCESTSVLA